MLLKVVIVSEENWITAHCECGDASQSQLTIMLILCYIEQAVSLITKQSILWGKESRTVLGINSSHRNGNVENAIWIPEVENQNSNLWIRFRQRFFGNTLYVTSYYTIIYQGIKKQRHHGHVDRKSQNGDNFILLGVLCSSIIMEMIRRFSLSSKVECFLGMVLQRNCVDWWRWGG